VRISTWPASRPVAVPCVSSNRISGRRSRSASISALDARVSPNDTACTQIDPGSISDP